MEQFVCGTCEKEHDGSYGSGRFCSNKCARAFSTLKNRAEINKRVSMKMKGKRSGGKPFCKGYDPRRGDRKLAGQKAKQSLQRNRLSYLASEHLIAWENLPRTGRYRRVFIEQQGKCKTCGFSEWLGIPLTLEIHHINGNKKDETRNNLVYLCPNCHSLTPNFRRYRTCPRSPILVEATALEAEQ